MHHISLYAQSTNNLKTIDIVSCNYIKTYFIYKKKAYKTQNSKEKFLPSIKLKENSSTKYMAIVKIIHIYFQSQDKIWIQTWLNQHQEDDMRHSHAGITLGFRASKHTHQCLFDKTIITFQSTKPKIHSHHIKQNCVKIHFCYSINVNLYQHYSCCIQFLFFLYLCQG